MPLENYSSTSRDSFPELPSIRTRSRAFHPHSHGEQFSKLLLHRPTEVETVGPVSIADAALARYKKTFPKLATNRVYVPWYRRYATILPEEQQMESQPYDEVQRRDEDIALQYFYGDEELLWDRPNDKLARDKRRQALSYYNKLIAKEEEQKALEQAQTTRESAAELKVQSVRSIIELNKSRLPDMKEEFGPTAKEMKKMNPIVDFLTKLHVKKRRRNIRTAEVYKKPTSKWHLLSNPAIKLKIKQWYAELMRRLIRQRFRKVIQLVCCVYRFINMISIMSGDTRRIFKSVKAFQEEQIRQTELKKTTESVPKSIFDPQKYKIAKEIEFPMSLNMILTKPWSERTDAELQLVVDNLQKLRSFVEYPPAFQFKLARVAWLIEVPKNKVIIRQRHIAQDFYFILAGKARMSRLEGDPYFKKNQDLKSLAILKKDSCFGDECLAHPESERNYSVCSMDQSTMLAINVHDYSKMLMKKRDDETAPEHLRFLISLKFLKNFPKLKLLTEGDEYISMYYYRSDKVVAKSMEDSDYVYVVWSGSARVLVEIPPPPEAVAGYRARQAVLSKVKRGSPPPALKNATLSDMMLEFQERRKDMEERKSVVNATAERLLTDGRLNAQVKEMQRKYSLIYNKQRELIKAEGDEIRKKSLKLLRTLPRSARNSIMERPYVDDDELGPLVDDQKPRVSAVMGFSSSISSVPKLKPALSSSAASLTSAKSINFKVAKEEGIRLSSRMSTLVGSNIDLEEAVGKVFTEQPSLTSEVISEKTSESSAESSQTRAPTVIASQPDSLHSEMEPKKPRKRSTMPVPRSSEWKQTRQMVKGDYIGVEWLDYNDRPFEPPKEVMSLVSDGAELIMMKKCFLIKYLRKEW